MPYLIPDPAKKMRYSLSAHTERAMLAEAVLDFYALAYAGKSMSYRFSEHTERLILAETVFNFYALS